MTNIPAKDMRPEGSLLYQAAMYGLWNEVLYLFQHAAAAGHSVMLDYTEHPHMRGFGMNSVEIDGVRI